MSVTLVSVEVRNGDIQKALKLFKQRVEKSGHIQELRDRREYKKPSTIKREQRNRIKHQLELEKKGVVFPKKTKKFTEK
jgi:small subunit ribosomal protein S21